MNFLNLTPHTINVKKDEEIIAIPSSGIARVSSTQEYVGEIGGFPVHRTMYGEVEGLPAPQEDTIYIVSAMVLSRVPDNRTDVVGPDTGSTAIRNEKGQIVAVLGFVTK